MFEILNAVNDALWTYLVIAVLVGCALYFTIRSHGVQFTTFKDMIRITFGLDTPKQGSNASRHDKIGSFKAFAVSLSSRVGTGNLAGVASAIFIGGPGAVFWMWMMALLGSATAFVEATLAQLYKRRGQDAYYGGPAYYMEHGLHRRWMGVCFAIMITIALGCGTNLVQSNTMIDSVNSVFGWDKVVIGIVMTVITMLIVFGGIHRISNFASLVVPFMAVGFILIALYVVVTNISKLPDVFNLIFTNAFGLDQAGGGMVGAAISQGMRRGLFSNEAGEGSAPNAAAIASTSHPVKQGLLQALGVFVDTLVICSCTAMIILISGLYDSGSDGIILTTKALESEIGPIGRYFTTAAIILFAYSTLIANYYFGETNIRFACRNRWAVNGFRLLTAAIIMAGAFMSLQTVWCVVDILIGVVTVFNCIAISLLSRHVWFLLDDYRRQKREGREPVFHRSQMPAIEKDLEAWD